MWMGVVALQLEILVVETEDVRLLGVDPHGGQCAWLAGELQFALLNVVVVDVGIAEGVDKVAAFQSAGLRNHHREERIAGNVEGHTQEYVGRPLIQLATQPSVGHIELKQDVARGQVHLFQLAHIPGRHEQAARVRVGLDVVYQLAYLVHLAAVLRAPAAPLMAIDGTQLAVGASPFVPDSHFVVMQILHIGVAAQKPQQLIDDRAQMQFLGGQQWEAVVQVEPHLVAESAHSARTRAVALGHTIGQHMLQKVEILFHYFIVYRWQRLVNVE